MTTVSFRLPDEVARKLIKWSKMDRPKDKSTAARELMEYGWKFALLEQYRQGKLSLERFAHEVGLSVSEAMDFLSQHGAGARLDYDEYLKGLEHLRRIF